MIPRRAIGILASVAVFCGGAVMLESRAADEGNRPAAGQPVAAGQSPGSHAQRAEALTDSPAPATPAHPATTKPAAPGAPQVPEESATIRDDPTIAPDPKQSADNNVSFPNDI